MPAHWLATLTDPAGPAYRIGREGADRIAEWTDTATLRTDATGGSVRFVPHPAADPARVAKIERGIARALVASLHGRLTLHASAVARAGSAALFLGASGAGKSTLAGELCRRAGVALVADDMSPLSGLDDASAAPGGPVPVPVLVLPSESAVWLESPDAADKAPVEQPAAIVPARCLALVVLSFHADERDAVELAPLSPPRLFPHLIPAVVRFALDDPAAHARELAQLASLCRLVPGYELRRPRRLRTVPETADAALTLLPLLP